MAMDILPYSESSQLYNSRIVDNYIKLIKKKYGYVDVNSLLSYAKMTPYEVADEGHWFTQKQINLFHEKLLQETHNENIAREAGRYSISPDAIGMMRPFVLGMVDPATVYSMVGKVAEKFTKSANYESKKLGPNKVEIKVSPQEGTRENPFQCENRSGLFEAAALAFTNKLPQIEHPECVFSGGESCRYIISWEKSSSAIWKKIRNYILLLLGLTCLVFGIFYPFMTLTTLLPVSLVIVLVLCAISHKMEKRELSASLNYLWDSTDTLVEQININYNNALLTNEIGQAITTQTNISDILKNVVQISKKRLDYDRCMILLADPDKKRLLFRAGYGYAEDQLKLLEETVFRLDRPEAKGVFVVSFREQRPFLVDDIEDIKDDLSLKSLLFAKKLGSKAFICCPIISDEESIGVLAVDNLKSKKPLVQSDMSLLMGIASVLGISIRNAELTEARERQFRSILQTLAASIDARDNLTAGHSENVTRYALGICEELELSNDYREIIRVAALLHDYGKIGIPDSILKKPGKLTPEEFEIVKTHAARTERILDQINFEGIFSKVPEIAGAHHERFDGGGYPHGLKGEEIPLGARIIALADVFEAVTSKRHYRNPMPLDKALELLQEESGRQFDKKIVDAFFSYYSKTHVIEPEYKVSTM
jgi:HD-GYP domain-containing protein (c-di-GMP phosphodiesterase class II)